MDLKESLATILTESEDIALATVVGDVPDVRIMNCVYDESTPGVIYILTDAGSPKTEQFAKNDHVAIASIPSKGFSFVRSNDATVCKASRTLDEMKDVFEAQVYEFDKVRKMKGDKMGVFEIHMNSAFVQADFKNHGVVDFQ